MALENESVVEIVGVDAGSFVHLRIFKDENFKVIFFIVVFSFVI